VVYAVGTRVGGYDRPLATGELYAVNADGGSPAMLYGVRKDGMSTGSLLQKVVSTRGTAEFIAPIPADPKHILVATSLWEGGGKKGAVVTASRMDVRTGILRKLTTAPIRNASFVADHQGRIRFAWGEDDGSLFYDKWMADRAFLLVPAQAMVAEFLKTFQDFPPRQRPASFSIDFDIFAVGVCRSITRAPVAGVRTSGTVNTGP